MDNHISDIYIRSFRGISNLELKDIKLINILTGDNNGGKTSVLEVIQSIKNPCDFRTWRSLIRRGERISVIRGMSYYEGFFDLFDINKEEKTIEYDVCLINGQKYNVKVMAERVEEEIMEKDLVKLQGGYNAMDEDSLQDNLVSFIFLKVLINWINLIYTNSIYKTVQLRRILIKKKAVSKLNLKTFLDGTEMMEDSLYEGQMRYIPEEVKEDKNFVEKIVYVSPIRHAEGNFYLSQILAYPEMYEQMLQVLKEYDEDIISINYDDNERRIGNGTYKILSKSNKKALPLNVYGDGMKKAILLMSAVIAAKDGILLLDEFETAIHTSAMNKTFKWIIESCKKLNVQVFMTSHSKEAIDKVLKCSTECIDDMAVYTLYKDSEGTSVRRLDGKMAIEAQDEMGLELR